MHKLFPSQLEDEKIYIVVRQHWVVLLKTFHLVYVCRGASLVQALWGSLAPRAV